ncbi:hypothetical protein [Micromonospora sp. RTP1Z1]|uniref:hypothetical protein n=1 Tax=Micromonospora sp. RTP1Z1 TaxID=2994043 RepID=UPI0029C6AAEA|nr:hypothetical protein [Micromonospora sp. RTP1Z1]
MLIVCGSLSGAPGVSTAAVGLAAQWPGGRALLVEADPSGGVVAARFGLAQQPGLTSLAASTRHGGGVESIAEHLQGLPLGIEAVVAPGSADTVAGSVTVLGRNSGTVLRGVAGVVVADVGRLYPGSPAGGLLPAADAVLVLASPATEYLDHVDARMPWLREVTRPGVLGLALAGPGSYPAGEIAARLGAPVWAVLPRDRWGAGVLTGRLVGRAWQRTRLVRALRDLAATLHQQVTHRDEAESGVVSR